jgi:hypothetical protein
LQRRGVRHGILICSRSLAGRDLRIFVYRHAAMMWWGSRADLEVRPTRCMP